jgi:hypothetical protein
MGQPSCVRASGPPFVGPLVTNMKQMAQDDRPVQQMMQLHHDTALHQAYCEAVHFRGTAWCGEGALA